MSATDLGQAPMASDTSLWSRLKAILQRCRPWAVGVFVVVGLLTPLFPGEFRYIPLTALLGVVAQALLEILGQVSSTSPRLQPRVVADVIEALPEMRRCVEECRRDNQPICVRWIGMTMFQAWNSLEQVLDDLAQAGVRGVTVEIAMLTGDWLEENPINPEWTPAQADGVATKIQTYFSAPRPRSLDWRHHLHRYAHMPILHGGLIGDRCLCLGISRWDEGSLKAGKKPYEVHRSTDGPFARDRISVYRDWFAFCAGGQAEWYAKNLQIRGMSGGRVVEASLTERRDSGRDR